MFFQSGYTNLPSQVVSRQVHSEALKASSSIEVYLPAASSVTLKLFNTAGEEILTVLQEKEYDAGAHEVHVDDTHLNDTIYLYRLVVRTGRQQFVDVKPLRLSRTPAR